MIIAGLLLDGQRLGSRVYVCETFLERALGLWAQGPLMNDELLRIAPCRAVHTLGLRIAIDLVFVDRAGRVLDLVPALPPNRIASRWGAWAVWEAPAGWLQSRPIRDGSRLELCSA